MPNYKPQGLGTSSSFQDPKPKTRTQEKETKEEEKEDPNSILNVLKRGFLPMSERAEAELAIKRRQK
jgi:hypothetical protein